MTHQELAAALLVTNVHISSLLSKMEHDGLIVRQKGRTRYVSLSRRGQTLLEELVPLQRARIADKLAPRSVVEQRELDQGLKR